MLAFFYFIGLFIMYKIIALLITIFFSSHLFADNNLAEERSMIQNERNNLAIGWRDNLGYDLPKPGTYTLYNIRKSGDGKVIDEKGNENSLHNIMNNKITLLSFIYSNCTDTNGCPLATSVFYKIQEKIKNSKEIAKNLKMISLSFDPEYDTPEIMHLYGKNLSFIDADWDFLTTNSLEELEPILSSYDQPVIRRYNEDGSYNGVESHLLRVFLIDDKKLIRNVYNVDFLHAELLINDIKTLLLDNE
jgi:cytochrome c peroxidase